MAAPLRPIRDSINVTPLADVMLVLLVIFIVVTPLLKPGMGLPIPEAQHAEDHRGDERTIVLSIREDGSLFLNRSPIAKNALVATLRDRSGTVLFLEAAERLDYREVRAVMDDCRRAGAGEVALVTREPKASS